MPSMYITRMLVVAIVYCSALAGKAFADITGPPPSQKLGQYLGVHSSTFSSVWSESNEPFNRAEPSDITDTFNITMSMCLSMDAIVGIYHFTNGTSKNDATIYDISEDMKQLIRIGSPLSRYDRNLVLHAIANAQLAVNDINAYFDSHVSCDNVAVSSIDHTELRRLLADPPDRYWATTILQALVAGTNAGIGLAIGELHEVWGIPLISSLVILVYILNGWLAQLQRTGKMSYLGALLGNIFSSCIRREVEQAAAIGPIDACEFATNSPYRDSISSQSSYGTATAIFDVEQGAEGLPCSS